MSVKLMSAIFETEFRDLQDQNGNITKASTAKLVLLAMADHANDEGEGIYPSIEKLCKKTALSDQTIRNTWDALRHNGIIFLTGESKHRTNNHTINTESFPRLRGEPDGILTLKPFDPQTVIPLPSTDLTPTLKPFDPNHHITKYKTSISDLQKIEDSANKTVDAILDNARKAEELKESHWQGRENYPPHLLIYADWWQKKTGLSAGRKLNKSNLKAFNDWYTAQANEYALEKAWDSFEWQRKQGTLTADPNKLTSQIKGWMSAPQQDKSKRDPNETANESRLRAMGI